jgi:hypothetical protein
MILSVSEQHAVSVFREEEHDTSEKTVTDIRKGGQGMG